MKSYILTLLTIFTLTQTGVAEIVKVKGQGEVVYSGIFKPGSTDERTAILAAKKNALSRYVAGFDSARLELYKRVEPEVLANIDHYVPDYLQLDQETDKATKLYKVTIEASVDSSMIERAIQTSSGPTPNTATGGESAEGSYITFVFVARETASRKAFDEKRTDVAIHESSDNGKEKNQVADDGQSAERSLDKNSIIKTTTGGNTETKADDLAFRVNTSTEVDNAVNSVLTKARYETVDPTDAGLDITAFKNDFSDGSDISPATRSAAIKVLKEKQIRYLAIANMDVGLPQNDDVTGLKRVYVTVTAKVTDLNPKFPKTVASIAGKPYAGLGPDSQVAKKNALNEAAANSASELVDQLRMKNVR